MGKAGGMNKSKKNYRLKILYSVFFLLALLATGLAGWIRGEPASSNSGHVTVSKPDYSVFIDIESNRLYILKDGKSYKEYKCATGMDTSPSPAGEFKVISKAHWGEGFGGYWIGIDCPWGNYGIHGTTSPDTVGYATSHGCFRMYNEDCREVYNIVSIGTGVFITAGCYGPFGSGFRVIRPQMYGPDVLAVQKRLRELGYFKGWCNGRYDNSYFKTAIHLFQRDNGLKVSDDIDRNMIEKLGYLIMD